MFQNPFAERLWKHLINAKDMATDRNLFFEQEVEAAVKALKEEKIILYPTDTIWGIGCNATASHAVDRIYTLKQRPDAKSMIILVADERDILQYVAAPDPAVFHFLEAVTKPTTIIFDGALGLPDNLVAPDGSVAIRLVQDPFCRHIIRRLRKPIVSTSANISGQPSPANFHFVSSEIKSGVDHIVAWRQEETIEASPSQIIKWNNGREPTIIRA
jgi:L-threonylcarbamoyladenylate synthase